MTSGAAVGQPHEPSVPWRQVCLGLAALVAVVALVPPVATEARRVEYVAAIQFSLLAFALPSLVALGAPWRALRLTRRAIDDDLLVVDRLAARRIRHRELVWSVIPLACDVAVVLVWHIPAVVAAGVAHGWVAPLEAVSLLVFGLGLWLELVVSPPLLPRSGYLRRAVLSGLVMWAFWILAYWTGLSTHDVYRSFPHVAGGLSAAADQQIASAVLWFAAAVSLMPVVFWNAMQWLQSEDPDLELLALARQERRRGVPPVSGPGGGGPAPT
jgi:cytochrome c oxidase assembly factor CtaG